MNRPSSQPFLPSISLSSLDEECESPNRPGTGPGHFGGGEGNGEVVAMSPNARAALSSHAFDVVQPLINNQMIAEVAQDIARTEQVLEGLEAQKQQIHVASKDWHSLPDTPFSNQLRDSHARMKQLDFEYDTAEKSLTLKRARRDAMQEAQARQDACTKRARQYDKRRQETQQAALREQEALAALAKAKQEEGTAKRALLAVGQVR